MKSFGIVLWLFGGLMGGDAKAQAPGRLCPDADLALLQEELSKKSARELSFFASWCVSCKKSLMTADQQTIFIASFDEVGAVEATVKVLRGDGSLRCFWDRDNKIAQHYKVKSLPALRQP